MSEHKKSLEQEPFEISDLMPTDTPAFMFDAWIGAISFALQDDKTLACFRKGTGNNWRPGVTPLKKKIDEATGADVEFIKNFVAWANVNVWGDVNMGDDEEENRCRL